MHSLLSCVSVRLGCTDTALITDQMDMWAELYRRFNKITGL